MLWVLFTTSWKGPQSISEARTTLTVATKPYVLTEVDAKFNLDEKTQNMLIIITTTHYTKHFA